MKLEGVRPGTLLFDGDRRADAYTGTARIFSRQCGPRTYQVTGAVSDNDERVTLYGNAPRLNLACQAVGYRQDILVFELIKLNEGPE